MIRLFNGLSKMCSYQLSQGNLLIEVFHNLFYLINLKKFPFQIIDHQVYFPLIMTVGNLKYSIDIHTDTEDQFNIDKYHTTIILASSI